MVLPIDPAPSGNRRSKPRKPERVANLEYENWRRELVYQIYGRQWDELPKTARGRRAAG